MTRTQQEMDATPDQVWKVLADGWLYPCWVVGATRMRDVEADWPAPGAKLHHSVGVWPATIDDDTEVVESVAGHLLRLRARAWPAGEAEVVLHIEARGTGSLVTIEEDVVTGPATLMPAPARAVALQVRNRETLRRLGWMAERRV
ncbi:MAG TPA: SRPBCC family protein [Nocardioides sp.]|jgi:uncharacterized protein YndB with AHSA1/START domain|nr:SRPBCC family protein [Nocardioides sp.]